MPTIHIFGNPYLEFDSLAIKVAKNLEGNKSIKIIYCNSPEILIESEENEIIILDVIKGISKISIITDISQIKTRKLTTMHDFDLGFFLHLMKELGINKKIKIIGVPESGDIEEISKEVEKYHFSSV